MTASRTFTITDLATEFGITPRTLRFYEDKGLLNPVRQGLTRVYSRRDRARVKLILRGKRLGFSLTAIQEMLDLYDLGDGQITQAKALLARSRERLCELERQRRDVEETIDELTAACQSLEQFLLDKGIDLDDEDTPDTTVVGKTPAARAAS